MGVALGAGVAVRFGREVTDGLALADADTVGELVAVGIAGTELRLGEGGGLLLGRAVSAGTAAVASHSAV